MKTEHTKKFRIKRKWDKEIKSLCSSELLWVALCRLEETSHAYINGNDDEINLKRFLEAQSFALEIKKVKEETIKKIQLEKAAPEMLKALKSEIEMLKVDLKFEKSTLVMDGYKERIIRLEQIIKKATE